MKVIAYHVTARRAPNPRGFRRCGRWFPVGETVRVDVCSLTTAQAEYLASSNPRDMVVETIREGDPPKPGGIIITAEKVAPPTPPGPTGVIVIAAPAAPADGIGTSPSVPDAPKKGRGR